MAGVRGLGRVLDVVTTDAAANTLKVNTAECSGVGILAVCTSTASSTLTIKADKTYGGTASAAGVGTFPSLYYTRTSSTGTAAWTDGSAGASTVTATGVVTIAGATAAHSYYTDFLVSYFAEGYSYLSVVGSTDFWVTLILYDLTVQRSPLNLITPAV
jgi:hypothetical protein